MDRMKVAKLRLEIVLNQLLDFYQEVLDKKVE